MKTPREVLLGRHRAAESRLDAIRNQVVAEYGRSRPQQAMEVRSHSLVTKLWEELVWPCRRIWLGMAAVWVLVLVFNWASSERGPIVADNAPPPTADVVSALKEQKQMLAQLLDTGAIAVADRPRIPGPRSEQRQTLAIG